MMTNEEKIEKIKNERFELLKKVSESVKNNSNELSLEIDDVLMQLNLDEVSVKRYEALVSAQELIENLTSQIVETNDPQEIIEIRKKLNYYINKIKNEAKKRQISQEKLDTYQAKASYLRKDIAKYIRFLKRENNINEIESLNSKIETLSKDDLKKLKRLIKNELSYVKRNSQDETSKKSIHVDDEKKEVVENSKENDSLQVIIDNQKVEDDKKDSFLNLKIDKANISRFSIPELHLENINDFLDYKVDKFRKMYGIKDTYDYGNSIFSNLINFVKNVPIYYYNRKRIRNMQFESDVFYGGQDLLGYVEYSLQRNSIKNGLKSLFSKSYLYSDETKCLNDHNRCVEWIVEHCNLDSYQNTYKVKAI